MNTEGFALRKDLPMNATAPYTGPESTVKVTRFIIRNNMVANKLYSK